MAHRQLTRSQPRPVCHRWLWLALTGTTVNLLLWSELDGATRRDAAAQSCGFCLRLAVKGTLDTAREVRHEAVLVEIRQSVRQTEEEEITERK